jgi:hypothetical protein
MALQKDRIYELIIGNYENGEGIKIDNLQINFHIKKSSSHKDSPDRCKIKVYNLSNESLSKLNSEYMAASLKCGYKETGLRQLYSGEITYFHTNKSGVDRITEINIGSSYLDLHDTDVSEVVPAGATVEEVIERIRKSMANVAKGIYSGDGIRKQAIYGYPLSGTAKQMLDEVSEVYDLEYRIDDRTLYINDSKGSVGGTIDVPVLSTETGLIELPYYTSGDRRRKKKNPAKKEGIEFTSLLNVDIKPGRLVKLETEEFNNFYKVDSAEYMGDYRGQEWYVKAYCSLGDVK